MSSGQGVIHLVGGGRDEDSVVGLFAPFVQEAAVALGAGAARPRIHALLVLEEDDEESVDRFARALTLAGADVTVYAIIEGQTFGASAIDDADGIFVGGGLTPAYHAAFADVATRVRERVASGTPYLGFSAGAAIAAEHAIIGGYLIDGVAVCDEDAGEELDEITVVPGLGLIPTSVDVHAAQWGTVSRLTAAAAAGRVASGIAIDEHTAVRWQGGRSDGSVAGIGSVWHIAGRGEADPGAVRVVRQAAASASS
jgi:cyanophycinase